MPSMSHVLASPSSEIGILSPGFQRIAEWLDVWCFRALLALLFLAPLPLGSNRTAPLSLLALGAWVLLAGAGWSLMLRRRSLWAYLSSARWPLLALLLYAVLVAAQALAGPSGAKFYSADAFQTWHYLLSTLVYLAAFAAVLLLVRDEGRFRSLTLVFLVSGVLQAVLAIGLLSIKAHYQFLYYDLVHGQRAIGSFANPNHLASYLYLCLSVGVGLLIAGLGRGVVHPASWRERMTTLLGFLMSPKMLVRLMLVVMVIALVLTRSRMGNTAFFASVSLIGLVVAWRFRDSRKLALLLVGSLLLVDMIVVGQWVGLERVMQRIEGTALEREDMGREESVDARTEPARHTVPMVLERPWTGYGGGTYFTAFPRFKSPHMWLYFDHAHNDYAEIAADTGLVGLGLLGAMMVLVAWRGLKLLRPESPAVAKAAGAAALMAVVSLTLHSTVDFSLQIPAVAFSFMLIAGMAWAAPLRSRDGGPAPLSS